MQFRLYVEVASDGVEIRANSTNGTQIFVAKCKSMMPDYIGTADNVKPLLIIPGPRAPKHFDVYWWMLFNEVFIKYGPRSAGALKSRPIVKYGLHLRGILHLHFSVVTSFGSKRCSCCVDRQNLKRSSTSLQRWLHAMF